MSTALRMHVEPMLGDPALILAFDGWNDAGEAATSALRFIDEAVHSAPLAEIDCEEFYDFTVRRPEVGLDAAQRRTIRWPTTTFRFGTIDGARDLVTCAGVEPHLRWRHFCDDVISLARTLGVKRAALLGAYLADVVYSQPVKVTGFASDPALLESIDVETSGYEGPTGIAGVLGERLQQEGIAVVSLWAGLPHYINASPNPRGALALVQKLNVCLSLGLKEDPLRQTAADFERKISQLVANDAELSEYVRQLKRREFAQ